MGVRLIFNKTDSQTDGIVVWWARHFRAAQSRRHPNVYRRKERTLFSGYVNSYYYWWWLGSHIWCEWVETRQFSWNILSKISACGLHALEAFFKVIESDSSFEIRHRNPSTPPSYDWAFCHSIRTQSYISSLLLLIFGLFWSVNGQP